MAKRKNLLICQSGGPTAVINASLVGAYQAGKENENIDAIYGGYNGILGVLREDLIDLGRQDQIMDKIHFTPSSALGSCRYKLSPDLAHPDYERIFSVFNAHNIGYFFYNGGNDSMDTANKLNKYAREKGYDIKIIGIPKTIDNDLAGTDNCPGYGSAARYINTSILEAAFDCHTYSLKTILLMEVMGRHSGWLAASGALAEHDGQQITDLIYLPEVPFNLDVFVDRVKEKFKEKDIVFIVVSEGITSKDGDFFQARNNQENDQFGHKKLGGVSLFLQEVLEKEVCNRVKVINPGILQRCATHFASATDMEEAYWVGFKAVEYAVQGNSGYMAGIKRLSNRPFQWDVQLIPLDQVANKEKKFPVEWITPEGDYITQEGLEYMRPLIEGDVSAPLWKGLPRYSSLKKEFIKLKLPVWG